MKHYFKKDENNIVIAVIQEVGQYPKEYTDQCTEFTPPENFEFDFLDIDGINKYKDVNGVPTKRTIADKASDKIVQDNLKADRYRKQEYSKSDVLLFDAIREIYKDNPLMASHIEEYNAIKNKYPKK